MKKPQNKKILLNLLLLTIYLAILWLLLFTNALTMSIAFFILNVLPVAFFWISQVGIEQMYPIRAEIIEITRPIYNEKEELKKELAELSEINADLKQRMNNAPSLGACLVEVKKAFDNLNSAFDTATKEEIGITSIKTKELLKTYVRTFYESLKKEFLGFT